MSSAVIVFHACFGLLLPIETEILMSSDEVRNKMSKIPACCHCER